jgi:hypothetical protein
MKSIEEALNTLISAANIAQKKGVYSLEESHYVYMAISYINSLAQQQGTESTAETTSEPAAPVETEEIPQEPTQYHSNEQ